MTVEEVRVLYEYDAWATNRTLDTVSGLSDEIYGKDLKSSHGGIHGTLVHIYGADQIWLDRWNGLPTSALPTVDDIPTFASLKEHWSVYRNELGMFMQRLDDAHLQVPLTYKDTRGNQYTQTLYRQLLHRVNHASYHRGQVVTMLRQIGAKPQGTDLIAFYREIEK